MMNKLRCVCVGCGVGGGCDDKCGGGGDALLRRQWLVFECSGLEFWNRKWMEVNAHKKKEWFLFCFAFFF